MEYLSGGSLSDNIERLREEGKRLRDVEGSRVVRKVLEAVGYLHELNTVHRDLKPGML